MQALGCWELPVLHDAWRSRGLDAVWPLLQTPTEVSDAAVHGMAASRSSRPVMTRPPLVGGGAGHSGVGGAAQVYASGFALSPYADIKPAGDSTANGRSLTGRSGPGPERGGPPRRLWHSSPGSAGG